MKKTPSLSFVLGIFAMVAFGSSAEIRVQSGSFDSDGVKIAFIVAGDGRPVVLVHGLDSSAGMNWELPGTFRLLAQTHRVIALDLRGHGQSDKPTTEAAYGQPMVEDITRLMDRLKIEKAQVVGYSLGGIIVMKFMVDHPDRVISGTLGGMGWLRDGSALQDFWERIPGRSTNRTPPACIHGIARLAITEEQLKSIRVPVEVIVGDRDPVRRLYVDPLHRVRGDWPIIDIAGAGHLNCIAKDQFKQELSNWLNNNAVNQ